MAGGWWRRHWRMTCVTAVGLVGFGLIAFGPAGLAVGLRGYAEWSDQHSGAQLPRVGTEVRDGEVAFVVHTVRCGAADPGRAVHGRLCELTIGVRNHGADEVTVPAATQRLAGPGGVRHLPVPGEPAPFGTLAPGEAATARLTYDLPEHVPITHIEVQASPYTEGRAVALSGPPLPLHSARP